VAAWPTVAPGRLRPRPLAALRARLAARTAAWVRRRQGEDALPVDLERRRLYILPTRGGVAFGALVFVMLMAGLNYTNALALFLAFLLAAFGLVVMQQCHRNLLGVSVLDLEAPPVFAGEPGALRVTLGAAAEARPRLEAGLEGPPAACADVGAAGRAVLLLPLAACARGVHALPRVRIATAFPFGLFRAWTWVHVRRERLVYPAPRGRRPPPAAAAPLGGVRAASTAALDEWRGLRPLRHGDSPRQVDWKAYARGAPLLVKEYQPLGSERTWFDFAALAPLGEELRLEQLARWIVDAEAAAATYGLRLPRTEVPGARGPAHRERCLAALARFGTGERP